MCSAQGGRKEFFKFAPPKREKQLQPSWPLKRESKRASAGARAWAKDEGKRMRKATRESSCGFFLCALSFSHFSLSLSISLYLSLSLSLSLSFPLLPLFIHTRYLPFSVCISSFGQKPHAAENVPHTRPWRGNGFVCMPVNYDALDNIGTGLKGFDMGGGQDMRHSSFGGGNAGMGNAGGGGFFMGSQQQNQHQHQHQPQQAATMPTADSIYGSLEVSSAPMGSTTDSLYEDFGSVSVPQAPFSTPSVPQAPSIPQAPSVPSVPASAPPPPPSSMPPPPPPTNNDDDDGMYTDIPERPAGEADTHAERERVCVCVRERECVCVCV